MEVNINNYEEVIIDYLDNKLSPVAAAQLFLFLQKHPEINKEFEGLETFKVQASLTDSFGFNEVLKQPADFDALNLSKENFIHYSIAAFEGDLSAKGMATFNRFLAQHPELALDNKLVTLSKVYPDNKLKYPIPSQLKRYKQPFLWGTYVNTAIAASILLLISIFLRMPPENEDALNDNIMKGANQQIELEGTTKKPIKAAADKDKETPAPTTIEIKEAPVNNKSVGKKPAVTPTVIKASPIKKIEKRSYIINTTGLITHNSTDNFYSNLYPDILLSQELAMATYENELTETEEESTLRNNRTGRFIHSIVSSGSQVAEQVPQSLSGWLVADMGVMGFNLITNNNYRIERQLSDKGKIEKLKLSNEERNL